MGNRAGGWLAFILRAVGVGCEAEGGGVPGHIIRVDAFDAWDPVEVVIGGDDARHSGRLHHGEVNRVAGKQKGLGAEEFQGANHVRTGHGEHLVSSNCFQKLDR